MYIIFVYNHVNIYIYMWYDIHMCVYLYMYTFARIVFRKEIEKSWETHGLPHVNMSGSKLVHSNSNKGYWECIKEYWWILCFNWNPSEEYEVTSVQPKKNVINRTHTLQIMMDRQRANIQPSTQDQETLLPNANKNEKKGQGTELKPQGKNSN